jgi:hypothetical protein
MAAATRSSIRVNPPRIPEGIGFKEERREGKVCLASGEQGEEGDVAMVGR